MRHGNQYPGLNIPFTHEMSRMDAQKLAKVLAMAASDNETEALHALRTARRLLDAFGVDFVEVARRVADNNPAGAGTDRARMEDLEDAVFDLRNEIRHLRAENERLRQGRGPGSGAHEPTSLAEAAKEAAAAIRLRAELAQLRDEMETLRGETLAAKAHAATLADQLQQAVTEANRIAARLEEVDSRRIRQEAENRRLATVNHALTAELAEVRAAATVTIPVHVAAAPKGRRKAKGPTSQYALL